MKKIISLVLILTMLCGLLAACGKEQKEADAPDVPALEAMETIWKQYADDDRFAAMGGDYDAPVMDAPGASDPTQGDSMELRLGLPAAEAGKVDEAACLVHMMNANTFTAGAFHTVEGTDLAALAQTISDNLTNRAFICGWPEKLVIFTVGSRTVISLFGAEELVDTFVKNAKAAYADAAVVVEQSLIPA